MPNGHERKEDIDRIYEKTQRITEALYRVTDLFSDQEPLKWLLRKQATGILEGVLSAATFLPNERPRKLDILSGDIGRTLRILDLSSSNTFISENNFQVLRREYSELAQALLSAKGLFLPDALGALPASSSLEAPTPTSLPEPVETKENPIGHLNGHSENKENVRYVRKENAPEKRQEIEDGTGDRKEKILSFVKNRDWVSLGDLTSIFEGSISEKTVQRELSGMVDQGLLLKEGDKRWRRYRLKPETPAN